MTGSVAARSGLITGEGGSKKLGKNEGQKLGKFRRKPTCCEWVGMARERGCLGYIKRPGRAGFTAGESPWRAATPMVRRAYTSW